MSADDSFASLDLNSSQERALAQTAEDEDDRRHVLGAPPSDNDFDDDPSSGHVSDTGSYVSGTSEYNLNDLPVAQYEVASSSPEVPIEPVEPVEREPEKMPEYFVQPNERRRNDMKGRKKEKYADLFLQVFLSSALASCPLNLREGFTPDEIDRALSQTMKIKLAVAGFGLLGERNMANLPNDTNTEVAHALKSRNWLTMDNKGKFFPVMSKDLEVRMAQTMLGAEFCYRRSEKKKREAEEYKTADSEIRAMHAFNMIVELMGKITDEQHHGVVQYQSISTAFEKMVRKEKYGDIREKYEPYMNFSVTDKWNNEWFKANTNRSSLKKFVTMSKFSEIVALPNSTYKFRTHSRVRKFTVEDMKQVEERFANGGNRYRGNYGGGGGDRSNGPRQFQSKKKEIVPDPDYQPVVMTGSDDPTDDGSLQPTSSSKTLKSFARQNAVGCKPGSPTRRSQQESPTRRSRSPSPPTNKFRGNDPFGGGIRPLGDGFGGSGARGSSGRVDSDRDGFEGRNANRRVNDIGDTSSESDDTSDGEYSDEDESAKNERMKKREEKKAKKEAKRMNRKQKTVPQVDHSRNRFATSSFPGQSETPAEPADTVRRTRPSTSSRITPQEEPSRVYSDGSGAPTPLPARSESPDHEIIPPTEIPLVISNSSRDYRNTNLPTAIPFQPAKEHILGNARKERKGQEKMAATEAVNNASNTRFGEENTYRGRENQRLYGTTTDPRAHPGLAPRQQQQEEFREPDRRAGFGKNQRMESRAGPVTQSPYNQGPSPPMRDQDPYHDNNSYQRPVQPPMHPRLQPHPDNDYQPRNREHYDNQPDQHRSQFYMQPQRQQNSYDREVPNYPSAQCDPYFPHARHQGPVHPPPLPPNSSNLQYQDYRPPQHQVRNSNWGQQRPPTNDNYYDQQSYQQSYAPQPPPPQQYPHPNQNPSYPPQPGYQPHYAPQPSSVPPPQPSSVPPPQPSSVPTYNGWNGSQNYHHEPQQQMQYDNRPLYIPPPPSNRGSYGGNGELVSTQPTALNAAGRHLQRALQHQQGNPDGHRLIQEAIKYEITNYLIQSRNRQQSVFESDLREMVLTLGRGNQFDIVDFIRREMSVSVRMQYNRQYDQFEFFSLM